MHSSERRRVARELHDRVAHSLGVALNSLELHAAYRTTDPRRAERHLTIATHAVRGALDRVRELCTDLRGREAAGGIEHTLADYLNTVTPPALDWTIAVSGDEAGLPARPRDELYLILREAARNALIHAAARHLAVVVDIGVDAVHATVTDDGCGFDPGPHLAAGGLASMRERAALLGGTLTVWSRADAGTVVRVLLPIVDEETASDQQ